MDAREALGVLDLRDGVALVDVRRAYRALLRTHHPDLAGADVGAHARTARLTLAYEVLVAHAEARGSTLVVLDPVASSDPQPAATPGDGRRPGATPVAGADEAFDVIDAQSLDEDTIAVDAPAAETYAALYEAAGRIGEIAYVDRQLGILETIVRFEGGPSCSVVLTLQGRAHFTEVFCTMESIEAAPAPPIGPVIDALVAELQSP